MYSTSNNHNKKAVIYCRVSTKEQVDSGGSLETQEKFCRDYAISNGFEIDQIFIERGETAKTIDRTQFSKLLAYCTTRKNGISAIIAYKIDRIARNSNEYGHIKLLLKPYGVKIISTSERFEDSPAGKFMENTIAAVAQFDNDVRAERSLEGMRSATKEGRYVWTAPVGFKNVKIDGKANIAPNEMAGLVKQTFQEIARNILPVDTIRLQMAEAGLRTVSGKLMARSYFYTFIKNPLYAGIIKKFGQEFKGSFEPLVTVELFELVQKIINNKNRKRRHYTVEHPDFPLRRFVFRTDGVKITGGWAQGRRKKYAYYWFNRTGMPFKKLLLEDHFAEYLNQFGLDKKHIPAFRQKILDAIENKLSSTRVNNEKLNRRNVELQEMESALIKKNIEGVISDDILKRQLQFIQEQAADITKSMLELPKTELDFKKVLAVVLPYMEAPGNMWKQAPIKQKILLQWFKFPQGVTFNGSEFRTAKMCKLFRVKSDFFTDLSSQVPSDDFRLNTPKKQISSPSLNDEELNAVQDEIYELYDIATYKD